VVRMNASPELCSGQISERVVNTEESLLSCSIYDMAVDTKVFGDYC